MKRILVIGRHTLGLASVLNRLYENDFDSIGAVTDAEALRVFERFQPDAVLIIGDVEVASKALFHAVFTEKNAFLPVIEHIGGVSGIVEKIRLALNK